jgi:hypothetical protein
MSARITDRAERECALAVGGHLDEVHARNDVAATSHTGGAADDQCEWLADPGSPLEVRNGFNRAGG